MTKLVALLFDRMTNLDFVGPHEVFSRLPDTEIVICSVDGKPVVTDLGIRLEVNSSLIEIEAADILFIPGGPGVGELLKQPDVLAAVARIGSRAAWVTSVCTGALVLGAAGLLEGYRATTHWAALEILNVFGATPVSERVVVDRNRISGGGVTAGIDFGLQLAAMLHGEDLAKTIQLGLEYAPAPPFDLGSPQTASPELVQVFRSRISKLTDERYKLAQAAWVDRKQRATRS